MKYRKKPVVIEAVQFTQEHVDYYLSVRGRTDRDPRLPDGVRAMSESPSPMFVVRTLEGDMRVNVGDWIITGVEGERYPCKDSIFRATYEEA